MVLGKLNSGFADAISDAKLVAGDIVEAAFLNNIFTNHPINSVMHFAFFIQDSESVVKPAKYYDNNVSKTLFLVTAMGSTIPAVSV